MFKLAFVCSVVLLSSGIVKAQDVPLVNNYGEYVAQERIAEVAFDKEVNSVKVLLDRREATIQKLLDVAVEKLKAKKFREFVSMMNIVENELNSIYRSKLFCSKLWARYEALLGAAFIIAYTEES